MRQSYEKRVLRVIAYIHDHLDGDLSLDRLADVAAMSRFHWHRVYTAVTGESLAQTVRRIRIYRASIALVQSPASLEEIAALHGYPSKASFSRAFKAVTGSTPAAYRQAGRALTPYVIGKTGSNKMYDVTTEHAAPRHLAVVPHKGDYMKISSAFETMAMTMAARGAPTAAMVGVFLHDTRNTPVEDLRSFAGAEVPEGFAITAPLEPMELAGGAYAVLHFKGPYVGLQAAYDYLFGAWLEASGATLREEPCFEVYHNSPADTAPDDLLTDIYLPLG